ncbi:MAG TPA: hypothetical protein VLI05_02685 [Candidatus Saccharimonadia bacterium]|nr:hypothetical protein [Candidatus Saccharimonadia bacterium]
MSSSPYQSLVELYLFFLASVLVINVVAVAAKWLVARRRRTDEA